MNPQSHLNTNLSTDFMDLAKGRGFSNYKSLGDDELISRAEKTVQIERESTAEVIRLFEEIQSRKLHLKYGYPSLFEMAIKHFGYCAASAMRRINAMRLIKDVPEAFEKIESGELSLSVANELQTYFQQEKKLERPYSVSAKIELVQASLGKSRRDVEREIANRSPERVKSKAIYAVSNDRMRMNISISKELLDQINRLRDLRSHVNPNMTIEELLTELVELGLEKHDPVRKDARRLARASVALKTEKKEDTRKVDRLERQTEKKANPLPPAEPKRRSRYISVKERPKHEPCCFIDPKTGHRCNSTRFLQLDHVTPFSQDGANAKENLRWLCGAHNRYRVDSKPLN